MKTMKQIFVSVLLVAGAATVHAQIVTNGDFEIPQVDVGIGVYSPANASWIWEGTVGIISPPGFVPAYGASFLAPAATAGSQIGFVQGAASSMSQVISLSTSGIYRVRYQDAGRPLWPSSGAGGDTIYQVSVDSNIVAQVATTTGQAFSAKEYTFISTAGEHALKFQIVPTTVGDNTMFLDAINVDLVQELPRLDIRVSQVELCWGTITNAWYQLQFRSTLTTNQWVPLAPGWAQGTGGRYCTNDAVLPGQTQRFYQVAVTNSPPQP